MATQQPTLANRNNNPGNLIFLGQAGATEDISSRTKDRPGFARFSTPRDGVVALMNDIELKKTGKSSTGITGDTTIADYISKYAPKTENNTRQYVINMVNDLGVSPYDKIKDVPTQSLARFHAKHEGYQGYQDLIPNVPKVGVQTASAQESPVLKQTTQQPIRQNILPEGIDPITKTAVGGARLLGNILGSVTSPAESGLKSLASGASGILHMVPGGKSPEQASQETSDALSNLGGITGLLKGEAAKSYSPFGGYSQVKGITGATAETGLNTITGGLGKGLTKKTGEFIASKSLPTTLRSIARGQIGKTIGTGALYGAGQQTASEMQKDSSFTNPSTYGNIAGNTALSAATGGLLAGTSKGLQKGLEKIVSKTRGKNAAEDMAFKRIYGIDVADTSPENVAKIEQLKKDEISRGRQGFTKIIQQEGKQFSTKEKDLSRVNNMSDDAVENVIKKISVGSGNIEKRAKQAYADLTEEAKQAGNTITQMSKAASDAGIAVNPNIWLKQVKDKLDSEIHSDADKKAIMNHFKEKILSPENLDKNGNVKFSTIDSTRVKRNELFKKDPASIAGKSEKIAGETAKDLIDSLSTSNKLTLSQQKALRKHEEARKAYSDNQDAQFLLNKLANSKVGGVRGVIKSVVAYIAAGQTGNPLAFGGASLAMDKISSKLMDKTQKNLVTSNLSRFMKDPANLTKDSSSIIDTLKTEALASKQNKAAQNRVLKSLRDLAKQEKQAGVIEKANELKYEPVKQPKRSIDGIKTINF